jgi:hypothetical protein
MRQTVELDANPFLRAVEIQDVFTDAVLPFKLVST